MCCALAVLAGCGIQLNEKVGGDAAVADSPPQVDAAVPDAPLPTGPFGTPMKILGLSSDALAEDDITLNRAETEVIFAANLANGKELYTARRANKDAAWGTPAAIPALASAGSDSAGRFSADELAFFYGGVRGGASEDVWVTTRATVDSPWGAPTRLAVVNSNGQDRWYNPCGNRYVMVSDRTNAGDFDLYEGVVGAAPTRLSISTAGSGDISPYLTSDCLTLYWSHDADIYLATRATIDAPWQAQGVAADLSTAASNEQDPWMSVDRHRMYFSSNADGEFDLYLATR